MIKFDDAIYKRKQKNIIQLGQKFLVIHSEY